MGKIRSKQRIDPVLSKDGSVKITEKQGGRVTVGEGTYMNSGLLYAGGDNITIGKFCRIGYEVFMLTNYGSNLLLADDKKRRSGGIIIGDSVHIGWKVLIRGGVTIGDWAIVGMGAVVLKNVEPFHMVGGNPARDLGLRPDTDKIIRLIKKRCGNIDGTPAEVIAKVKKQGYSIAEKSFHPDKGARLYIAPKGKILQYTEEFLVE